MSKKTRKVDVVSTTLTFVGNEKVTFEEILIFLNGKEYKDTHKNIEFNIIDNNEEDYLIGIVVTTQLKEIPPLRDLETKEYKSIGIDVAKESLAFANIFLYDIKRNVFIYEINKNGCYLNQFREAVFTLWNSNDDNENIRFDLIFPTIFRANEYRRVLSLDYYKRFSIELLKPSELINEFNETNNSILKSIKSIAEAANEGNADTITYNQEVSSKQINKLGLSKSIVKNGIRAIREVANKGYRENIVECKIEGFDMDSEDPRTLKAIDIFGDVFKETFKIENITIHQDTQQNERKLGIEKIYRKILPEIKRIIGD